MSLRIPFGTILRNTEAKTLAEIVRTRVLVRVAADVPELDLCMVSSIHLDAQRGAFISFDSGRGRQQVYVVEVNRFPHGLNTLSSALSTFPPEVLSVLKQVLPPDLLTEAPAPAQTQAPAAEAPAQTQTQAQAQAPAAEAPAQTQTQAPAVEAPAPPPPRPPAPPPKPTPSK